MISRPTVAQYLTAQLEVCGKSQKQVAEEVGFEKPNVITMFKQGASKLPLSRVGRMAKALGVDPKFLFSLCMQEYEPDTWQAIESSILQQPLLTDNEIEIIQVVRAAAHGHDPKLASAEDKAKLREFVRSLSR